MKRSPLLGGYKTIPALVSDQLREEILSGSLKPGEKIRQENLATRFGVSHLPIREALRLLESEGLIAIYAHRGAFVAHPSLEELEELYSIRVPLDGIAVRRAAANLADHEISRLEDLATEIEEAIDAGDLLSYLRKDREFHAAIYRASGWPHLSEQLDDLWNMTHHYRRVNGSVPDQLAKAKAFHRALLEALKKRDGKQAEKLMRGHLEKTLGELTKRLKETAKALQFRAMMPR